MTATSEDLLIPAASVEPKGETPASATSLEPATHHGQQPRSFEKQQQNDRKYYKQWITKMISLDGKWGVKTPEKRWELIDKKRKCLIKYRDQHRLGTTFSDFRPLHDEADELNWLRESFFHEIDHGGAGAVSDIGRYERDDDEELLLGSSPVKPELREDGHVCSRGKVHASFTRRFADNTDEDEDEDEDKETRQSVVCKAVSRGLSIKLGCTGFVKANIEAATKSDDTSGATTVKVELGARGTDKDGAGQCTKRTWKWMDGKMVVWPPFESTNSGNKTGSEMAMDLR